MTFTEISDNFTMSPSTESNITGQQSVLNRKDTMNTVDKIVNEIAQKLSNSIVETANYKVLYDEAQEKLAEMQAQLERVNNVLDADQALKELFDEVADKLEKEK